MTYHKNDKKLNYSRTGNMLIFLMLCAFGIFMALPLVYSIVSAFKPMEEIFLFPPEILYVRHPTLNNFTQLFQLTSNLWIPFSRYIFNSTFVCIIGTVGNIFICSMAAYPLAKHNFPGGKFMFKAVQVTLLFTGGVTALPLYILEAKMGLINTYWALILPLSASPMSLYLMRQFMTQINDAVIEAARIDGTSEFRIYRSIIMPCIKPAWLTVLILAFQNIWNNTGGNVIYSEQLKLLPTALAQIQQGGIARAGVGAAASLLLMIPPIFTFIITQSNVIETMGQSGMKD